MDRAPDQDGPLLPPLSGGATATKVAGGEGKGNKEGDGGGDKGGKQR